MRFQKISEYISRLLRGKRKEYFFVTAVFLFFLFFFSPLLITKKRIFAHDTIWFYGIFHYFAESLANGIFPYWDPFNYSGQPFYPNLSIMHLITPITVFFVFINSILKASLLSLYHWYFMIEIFIAGLGVYFFSRTVNKYFFTHITVLFVFLFSSFSFISLRQAGFLYAFMWLPWVLLFLIRLVRKTNTYNTVGLALFLGLAMSGYQGLFIIVFILAFAASLLINKREFFRGIVMRGNRRLIIILISVVTILSMPLISVYIDKDNFVPMARMRTSPVKTDSYTNRTGSVPGRIGDFRGLISRRTAVRGYFDKLPLSEGFLHIGFIPLILALIGVFFARGEFKVNFICSAVFLFLIMLGDKGVMQRIVNFLFPPFQFVRHMQLFAGFFLFNMIYFVGKGCECLAGGLRHRSWKKAALMLVAIFIVIDLFMYGKEAFGYVTLPRGKMKFSEFPSKPVFTRRRFHRVVSSDDVRYYKPLLYKKKTAFNAASIAKEFSGSFLAFDLFKLYDGVNRRNGFVFSESAGRQGTKVFLENGTAQFSSWERDDKLAFLDIMHIITVDFLRHKEFYSYFDKAREYALSVRALVYVGYKEIKAGRNDWSFKEKALEYLEILIDLKLKLKNGAESKEFKFAGKPFNFHKRLAVHKTLYNMSMGDYIGHMWRMNHVEEFTLILDKDYRDVILLPYQGKARVKGNRVRDNLENITGISRDIIRFYSKVNFAERDDIREILYSSDIDGDLYIEGEGAFEGGSGTREEPFSYDVKKYTSNLLEIEYNSVSPGFLYYSDSYDKYWKAFIDGKRTGIYKAFSAFKAIQVPKGRHKVIFTYDPVIFRIALFLYYVVITACVVYLASSAGKAKR